VTVGRHGDVSPDQARKEAVRIIARIRSGEEPIPVAPKADPTKERSCERFLSEEEFRRLGRVLDEVQAEGKISANAVAAIRLLMLTGCRRGEIMKLRWEDVDLEAGELRLRDAKTGPRQVVLSPAAVRVLSAIPRHADNPWVIAGRKPGTRLSNLNASWLVVRERADVEDVRLPGCAMRIGTTSWKSRGVAIDAHHNRGDTVLVAR